MNIIFMELTLEETNQLAILLARYLYQTVTKLKNSVLDQEDEHTIDLLDIKAQNFDKCLDYVRQDLYERLSPYKITT